MDDPLEQKNTEKYFADHHRHRQVAGEYREIVSCSCQVLGGIDVVLLLRSGEAGKYWDGVKDGCEEKEDEERQEEVSISEPEGHEGQTTDEETNKSEDWELHFFYNSLSPRKLKQKDINLPSSARTALPVLHLNLNKKQSKYSYG